MPEYALQMRQISKTYGKNRANDSINFSVKKGTIHGLAGENGAGKSTLMKILFGLVDPDSTSEGIFINGNKVKFRSPLDAIKNGVGMVQQHFALAGAVSALDNIILGAEPQKILGVVDRNGALDKLTSLAKNHLGVPWSQAADDLTVGLQQRVEILKLLFRHANILILDEPTAVLTPQEVEQFFILLRRLRDEGKTIILITHKVQEILSLCDRVTVLRHGKVTGDFSTQELTEKDLIKAMIGRDIEPLKKMAIAPGKKIIEIKNVSVANRFAGSLNHFNLDISQGEIVGLAGVEGSGQQALVESILGLCKYEGTILTQKPHKELNFGLISEDRHRQSLWLDASVADNCAIGFLKKFSYFGFLSKDKIIKYAKNILAPYNVKMSSVTQKISSLSGGNQQKIVVAREISGRKPDFLIASQPIRGVDVGAIEFIHQQILDLQKTGAATLLISSELEELCSLSDRIVVLFNGKNVKEFKRSEFNISGIGHAMTGGLGS